MELTDDLGRTWTRIGPLGQPPDSGAIQPTLLTHRDGQLQILCRSQRGPVVESWSSDGGRTWSDLSPTVLPNPNAGLDGVTLADGRHLLVYNHASSPPGSWGGPRSPLNVAVSEDGRTWKAALVLEDESGQEFSYPAVIQGADGRVHITYTWKRQRLRHIVVDPSMLKLREMPGGQWPGANE
jgi:predicted neuraminidase